MEVNKQLHAVFCGPLSDFKCGVYVTVAASIAVTIAVMGVIPYPHADVIDTAFRQSLEYILLLTVEIIVFNAACFFRDNGGCIHAQDEILR